MYSTMPHFIIRCMILSGLLSSGIFKSVVMAMRKAECSTGFTIYEGRSVQLVIPAGLNQNLKKCEYEFTASDHSLYICFKIKSQIPCEVTVEYHSPGSFSDAKIKTCGDNIDTDYCHINSAHVMLIVFKTNGKFYLDNTFRIDAYTKTRDNTLYGYEHRYQTPDKFEVYRDHHLDDRLDDGSNDGFELKLWHIIGIIVIASSILIISIVCVCRKRPQSPQMPAQPKSYGPSTIQSYPRQNLHQSQQAGYSPGYQTRGNVDGNQPHGIPRYKPTGNQFVARPVTDATDDQQQHLQSYNEDNLDQVSTRTSVLNDHRQPFLSGIEPGSSRTEDRPPPYPGIAL